MSKLERVIIPEILDSLDPADPRAVRSRWDLRWIDFYLGNSRWIVRQLKGRISGPARIMEIGAGEGNLCRKVHAASRWADSQRMCAQRWIDVFV